MVAILIIAVLLRFGPMQQSIWGDELFLYRIINGHSVGTILDLVGAEEKTPPLGFLLSRIFSGTGDGTVWARLPSLLSGLATIPLVYALGRRAIGSPAGLLAAAWIAFAAFEIFYATESRAYALVQCFCVASTLVLLIALKRRAVRWWALFMVLASLALYSHYIAVLVLGPQFVWAAWTTRRDSTLMLRLVLSHAAVAVVFAAWIPDFLEQAANSSKEAGFVNGYAPNTWPIVRQLIGHSLVGHPFLSLEDVPGSFATSLIVIGLTIAALGGIARAIPNSRRATLATPRGLIVLLAVAPLVLLFAYSARPDTSFLLARNMAVLVPYAVVSLAGLITGLRPRPLAATVSALVLTGVAIGGVVVQQPSKRKPDARSVARFIDREAPAGSVVINGAFVYSPNGPPAKAVLTYLTRPFVYAPGKASDRSSYIYFPGTQIGRGWETAFQQRRPIVMAVPGGERILNFLNLQPKYQPYYRLAAQYLSEGLAGGYGVRIWLPR